MTDREYRELLAELARREAKSRAERDRELKEHREGMRELRISIEELRASEKEVQLSRQKRDVQIDKQIDKLLLSQQETDDPSLSATKGEGTAGRWSWMCSPTPTPRAMKPLSWR